MAAQSQSSQSPASGNFETGSLTQRDQHSSNFVGSSSGVHFVRLVRAAFASTASLEHAAERNLPLPEDTVGAHEDSDTDDLGEGIHQNHGRNPQTSNPGLAMAWHSLDCSPSIQANAGTLPPYPDAKSKIVLYFRSWHPLLPFMWGPTILRDLDMLYSDQPCSSAKSRQQRVCHHFLLRCMFAVVSPESASITPADALAIAGQLASHNDRLVTQAILMAQLRCISAMALRTASSLSGLLSRMLLHGGLHRCPYRYEQLDRDSRDLRKRIFWSAYVLDRYLSQALGIPPAISDSDIDVCAPGQPELHRTQSPLTSGTSCLDDEGVSTTVGNHEFLLANLVTHAQLVSKVLELFHKSIHVRSIDSDHVLSVRAEANRWFNSLPPGHGRLDHPVLDQSDRPISPEQVMYIPFLHILYQQLLIAIHRPYLSLPQSSAEFQNSLQLSVRAAKQTNLLLAELDDLFWPGFVASAWMSGLILSFACQIGAHNIKQGVREVNNCLLILKRMEKRWQSAGRCHAALSTLLEDLNKGRSAGQNSHTDATPQQAPRTSDDEPAAGFSKRQRTGTTPAGDALCNQLGIQAQSHPAPLSRAFDDGFVFPQNEAWQGFDASADDIFRTLSWDSLFDSDNIMLSSALQDEPR